MEHQERADRLEREAGRMDEETDRVEGEIEDARRDWEAKQTDQSVPGAQPEPDDDDEEEEELSEAPETPVGEDPEQAVD